MTKLNQKKIGIALIGGGKSARRFLEAYAFNNSYELTVIGRINSMAENLAKYFGVTYLDLDVFLELVNDKFNPNVIIFSTPPGTKLKLFKLIVARGYRGSFIFEKPFSLDMTNAEKIIQIITELKLNACVAFSRAFGDYYPKSPAFTNAEVEVCLTWPFEDLGIDPLIHQGVHMLNYLIHNYNPIKINIKEVSKVFVETQIKEYRIVGQIDNIPFNCFLTAKSDINQRYLLNDFEIPPVNHLEVYPNMLNSLLNSTPTTTLTHLDEVLKTTKLHLETIEKAGI